MYYIIRYASGNIYIEEELEKEGDSQIFEVLHKVHIRNSATSFKNKLHNMRMCKYTILYESESLEEVITEATLISL